MSHEPRQKFSTPPWRDDPANVRPMLAVLADPPLRDANLAYEPKYDGIRALAEIDGPRVRLWSRLGNRKDAQFPEIVRALARLALVWKRPLLLDGEIVALDRGREPVGFQRLQGRIHLTQARDVESAVAAQPTAFVLFDVLRDGNKDLRGLPFVERRKWLERLVGRRRNPVIRLTEVAYGDGSGVLARAEARGWEGLIAKQITSTYQSGRRSPAWRKLKVVRRQEFVIGGWTEPRQTRQYFGALLLGVHATESVPDRHARARPSPLSPPPSPLIYVGSVGTGFTDAELGRVWAALKKLETTECPFEIPPQTAQKAHWTRPALVAEVKFSEWTADGKLRAPVYLGLRDDVRPERVVREEVVRRDSGFGIQDSRQAAESGTRASTSSARPEPVEGRAPESGKLESLIARLQDLEDRHRDGTIQLPDGSTLKVTNLRKVFWPELGLTKGDLMRHYVRVAPFLLPVVADRPLVMKRFPNGVHGKAFYQQRAPDDVPQGVRVEPVEEEAEVMPRLVGGSLLTLLYMAQLAAISQDPWFSRVQTPEEVDYAALDLDPQPGVRFAQVLDVARWIGDVLQGLRTPSVPKTSGARGLHVYIPLPRGTSYESSMLFCRIVATVVATRHPKVATVERTVAARGRTVYVDYLQNIRGKTLATAYSARANEFAGVSTPLTWKEVHEGIDPRDFTLRTIERRIHDEGDLWAPLRTSKPAELSAAYRLLKRS